MKIVGIKRDAIFSPNSVEKDRMILQQVGSEIQSK